jgi:hypothetical protein
LEAWFGCDASPWHAIKKSSRDNAENDINEEQSGYLMARFTPDETTSTDVMVTSTDAMFDEAGC